METRQFVPCRNQIEHSLEPGAQTQLI